MTKFKMMMLVILAAAITVGFTACGDDDGGTDKGSDDNNGSDNGSDAGTDNDSDEDGTDSNSDEAGSDEDGSDNSSDEEGSDNSSDQAGEDPFAAAGYDCSDTDTANCDSLVCANKSTYEAFAATDCSAVQEYCDGMMDCFDTLTECVKAECPAGGAVADADLTVLTECWSAFSACQPEFPSTK